MAEELEDRCRALVAELGLGAPEHVRSVRPLTGGVASDIALVDVAGTQVCIKFALPKLKVAADWHAPVHRNAAEYAWLKFAADLVPESAVKMLGRSETQHGFAMEFVTGDDVFLWKSALLEQAPDRGEARAVGSLLGRIHKASANPSFDRSGFENRDDFRALRIEPYLTYTAERHPGLAPFINAMAEALYDRQTALVHGDASPKNILFRGGNPILLDAECATMGDPAFDPAFCLNHLLLKALHLPGARARYLANVSDLWQAYSAHVDWEARDGLEARVAALLPMLFLARVDGKSPVEYLDARAQEIVRVIAAPLITNPPETLAELTDRITNALKEHSK